MKGTADQMGGLIEHHDAGESGAAHDAAPTSEHIDKEVILSELEKILNSKPFRSSGRSKQFLSYVVRHSLDGQMEKLKERTIGVEVYERSPAYATGDDPIVRVSAGEVRRRLEQYYHSVPAEVRVRIDIPLGSYTPQFHWPSAPMPTPEHLAAEALHPLGSELSQPVPSPTPRREKSRRWIWIAAISCFGVAAAIFVTSLAVRNQQQSQSALDAFWSPAFSTSRPVLICLAKPVVYRPSLDVYKKYSQTHPGTFITEDQRDNQELPLDPNEKIAWKDMEVYPGYGIASGDAQAALSISDFLTEKSKLHQLRIGSDYSFEDLRTSPSVVVGAFNNRWTMQMTSNLHFALVWGVGIREQGTSGRTWTSQYGPKSNYTVDYAIVTRLIDSKTGQFLVAIAGLGAAGTQTAGEFVSTPKLFDAGLKSAPSDWRSKNMQFVLQTDVIDSIPGPPHVVAAYFW